MIEFKTFPAIHPAWRGSLTLHHNSNTVIHDGANSKGKFQSENGCLTIDWERWPKERFFLIEKTYVHEDIARPLLEATRIRFRLSGTNNDITLRIQGSDLATYDQIFTIEEYNSAHLPNKAEVILDIGANIGLATNWFARRYPEATILSVEPDKENFDLLVENTRQFNSQCTPINAAIWFRDGVISLRKTDEQGKPLQAWGVQVQEARIDQIDRNELVKSLTIESLIKNRQIDFVDILKIDVEGSEFEIFSYGDNDWLKRVGMIIIETHDRLGRGCEAAVRNALSGDFEELPRVGENLFFRRIY